MVLDSLNLRSINISNVLEYLFIILNVSADFMVVFHSQSRLMRCFGGWGGQMGCTRGLMVENEGEVRWDCSPLPVISALKECAIRIDPVK